MNRAEFSQLFARVLKDDSVARSATASPDAEFDGAWYHVEPALLAAATRFHETYPTWNLVVKLDGQGAIAFWNDGGAWKCAHAKDRVIIGAVAVGAGDAFLAGWLRALMDRVAVPARLARAVQYATTWVEVTERTRDLVRPSAVTWPSQPLTEPKTAVVLDRRRDLRKEREFERYVAKGPIDLGNAAGHCGHFMTLNPAVAVEVRKFAKQLKAYFASPGPRRPLNCAVWAAPGSGKSFLVEEVAREVGARFHEINVSTMPTRADLSRELDAVRNHDEANILVMIDECMTPIAGAHAISALIGPLWRKSNTKKIAFVLVDSLPAVKSVDEFLEHVRTKVEKGPDLVSRINGPAITLTAPTPLDRAILVCSLVRRLHKKSAFAIEHGALLALVGDPARDWSPRAVEYVVEALEPTGGIVRFRDLRRIEDLCGRVGVKLPQTPATGSVIAIQDAGKL